MSLMSRLKLSRSAMLPLVAAGLLICGHAWAEVSSASPYAQTFNNGTPQPIQQVAPNGPIKPGLITIQEVLKAHPVQQQISLQPPTVPVGTAAPVVAAPQLKPSQGSAASL